MSWTAPRTWAADETVTAAIMNAHVRDNLLALSTWATDWTPTWSGGGGNPSIGNGTKVGRYISAGGLVLFYVEITMGSTTTYGSGLYTLDLPVTEVARRFAVQGHVWDNSASDLYPIHGFRASSDTVNLKVDATTAGNPTRNLTATAPVTLATGDVIYVAGMYEAA